MSTFEDLSSTINDSVNKIILGLSEMEFLTDDLIVLTPKEKRARARDIQNKLYLAKKYLEDVSGIIADVTKIDD